MPNARLCRNGLQNGGLHLSGTKFPGNTETGIDGSLPKKKNGFFSVYFRFHFYFFRKSLVTKIGKKFLELNEGYW